MMSKKKKQKIKPETKMDIIEIRARRFFAMIIDWYITHMIVVIPITFYLRDGDYLKPYMFDLSHYSFSIGLFLGLFGIFVGIFYYIVIPTYLWKGQTIGKKLCKVKVVTEEREDINLVCMLKRELIGASLLEGGIVVTSSYIRKIIEFFGFMQVAQILQYIAYGLTLISIVYAYFNKKSQSFHDKIAKTIVIKN